MKAHPYGRAYRPLLALSGLFALSGLLTLLPNPNASWPNILGYSSLCTFAPGASFACALLAALCCVARARLVRRAYGPAFIPILTITLLSLGLTLSTVAWAGVKADYADAASSASAAD